MKIIRTNIAESTDETHEEQLDEAGGDIQKWVTQLSRQDNRALHNRIRASRYMAATVVKDKHCVDLADSLLGLLHAFDDGFSKKHIKELHYQLTLKIERLLYKKFPQEQYEPLRQAWYDSWNGKQAGKSKSLIDYGPADNRYYR